MSEMVEKMSVGSPALVKTEAGHPTLYTDYESIDQSLDRVQEKYERDRADYYNTLGDDPEILKKTKRWQRSARELASWAGTLFNADAKNQTDRKRALDIFDRIAKEAMIRLRNVSRYADISVESAKENEKESTRDKMDNAEYGASAFARNAIETQRRYIDHFQKGDNYISPRQEREIEASAYVAEIREKVLPRDRMYLPGQVIPPHPVPLTERVPKRPDPYELYKNQPVEAYEYDREIDELVLKKGYVSEDGLIDDESVKYDPVNGKCTMKYR
ncbi:MAG: hypothetical protein II969_01480, partial [Anaerolineaceae bacterium]|nr:hypothetical protein [Anaerolineaceae bacterium]